MFLFCTLLLQGCGSNLHAVIEESSPQKPPKPGSDEPGSGKALAVASGAPSSSLPLTASPAPGHIVLLASSLQPLASSATGSTPSGGVLASEGPQVPPEHPLHNSHQAVVGSTSLARVACVKTLPPSARARASDAAKVQVADVHSRSVRPFTTSSGACVLFRQVSGHWQASLQGGVTGAYAYKGTLPVVSTEDVGVFLARLQDQDVWASRSRIHILATARPPYAPCVYLGKIGLLGGNPDESGEWLSGPSMTLDSNQTRTEVCHIQPGYRYKGYRMKSGSVIQRASCTIRYVEANSKDEIQKLEGYQDGDSLAGKLTADFGTVVNLGTLGGGVQSSSMTGHQGVHTTRFTHAGLVVYGSTKKNKLLRGGSRIKIALEICVEKIQDTSPVNPYIPPAPGADANPAARPTPLLVPAPSADANPAARPTPPIAPVPGLQPIKSDDLLIDLEKARALLAKKLADPMCALSESESISLLTLCVSDGAENSKQIAGKEAVIVIGNTGAGKSTFVNYLLGCEMIQKTPKELGIKGLKKLVVVRSKLEGGACDEVMPIGHDKTSKTFMPQIASDPSSSALAYCDCPGFLDNRGAEINIANAVNIKRALQAAKCVKVLILINYHSLLADRGRGLRDMLNICTQLFGSTANLERYQDALLLGVTQVPEDVDLDSLSAWLLEDTPKVMQVLSKRLFLYDPLNRGGADFWTQAQCASQLAGLKCIPQSQSCSLFQTVLTAEDEQKLVEIVEKQSQTLKKALDRGAYGHAGTCWQALQRLRVIDNIRVERLLHLIQLQLQHFIGKRIASFRECVVHYHFAEAEKLLAGLRAMGSHFDKADLELDLGELDRHYAFFQNKAAQEKQRDQDYRAAQARYAAETKQLLSVIEKQKQEMEHRLSTLLSEHAQETSKLRVEMIRRGEDYDEQIAKLRAESSSALRKQEEMQLLNQAMSAEERAKLQATHSQLRLEYEAKLAAAEREKALFRSDYASLLAQQEEAQKQSQLALQEQIAQLEAQKEAKKAELAQTSIPAMAIGAQAWEQYFGSVGPEPPLPADIDKILDSACPFWVGKRVKDTHLLVLIPASVGGRPFTLTLLGELIRSPKGEGYRTEYRPYGNAVQAALGDQSSGSSYWVLMLRDVLPDSRGKTYENQKALVAEHARRKGLPYELPQALEAATAILLHYVRTGERLYGDDPWTYTRCQETVANKYPVVVGGFSSGGLLVNFRNGDYYDNGVSCLRKVCEASPPKQRIGAA